MTLKELYGHLRRFRPLLDILPDSNFTYDFSTHYEASAYVKFFLSRVVRPGRDCWPNALISDSSTLGSFYIHRGDVEPALRGLRFYIEKFLDLRKQFVSRLMQALKDAGLKITYDIASMGFLVKSGIKMSAHGAAPFFNPDFFAYDATYSASRRFVGAGPFGFEKCALVVTWPIADFVAQQKPRYFVDNHNLHILDKDCRPFACTVCLVQYEYDDVLPKLVEAINLSRMERFLPEDEILINESWKSAPARQEMHLLTTA